MLLLKRKSVADTERSVESPVPGQAFEALLLVAGGDAFFVTIINQGVEVDAMIAGEMPFHAQSPPHPVDVRRAIAQKR